jgi:hypothetical protein
LTELCCDVDTVSKKMITIKISLRCWLSAGISRLRSNLPGLLGALFALALYASLLTIGLPQGFARLAGFTFDGLLLLAPVIYLVYRLPGAVGKYGSLSVTLVLFALPLSGYWNNWGNGAFWAVTGGLVPFTDAMIYYVDAQRLLEGDLFSVVSGRRPLFPGLFATLMGLTHQNFQITLAILVLIVSVCCFLLAREIRRTHGTVAGVIVIILLFLFYRVYSGTVMTEHLGIALGSLGLAVMWRGTEKKQIHTVSFGILLLTLALCARAGAFFVLPAIIFWGAWVFRHKARHLLRFLVGGCSAIILGFLLNFTVNQIVSNADGAPFSNFSHTLYGIASGGQDWSQVYRDHPELKFISGSELSQTIYRMAFELAHKNPGLFVRGILNGWREYLNLGSPSLGAFSFVDGGGGVEPFAEGKQGYLKSRLFLYALSLLGLVYCYRQRHDWQNSLVLAALLGIWASVPLVPPRDAPWMRAYAATIPFSAVLVAMGAVQVINWLPIRIKQWLAAPTPNAKVSSKPLIYFSIALTVFIIFGPIGTRIVNKPPRFAEIPCPPGLEAKYIRINTKSMITLVDDDSTMQGRFHKSLNQFRDELKMVVWPPVRSFYEELAALNGSTIIMPGLDLSNSSRGWGGVYLVADRSIIPEAGIVQVCGKTGANNLFYADSIKPVSVADD